MWWVVMGGVAVLAVAWDFVASERVWRAELLRRAKMPEPRLRCPRCGAWL